MKKAIKFASSGLIMMFLLTLTLVAILPISVYGQNLRCYDLFAEPLTQKSQSLIPDFLNVDREIENLIFEGPFQNSAFEIVELALLVRNSEMTHKLSQAFRLNTYDSTPEKRRNTNWSIWSTKLKLQSPRQDLQDEDLVLLWNIYLVLKSQFSKVWSEEQLTWMSSWLLEVVTKEHFQNYHPVVQASRKGPLLTLQNPYLKSVYEELLSDSLFSEYITLLVEQNKKRFSPSLKRKVKQGLLPLDLSMESQILVGLSFQVLYQRYSEALDNHDWQGELYRDKPREHFIPNNISIYLQDLFATEAHLLLATDLLEMLFVGTGIPILETNLKAALQESIKRQMEPIQTEALGRLNDLAIDDLSDSVKDQSLKNKPIPLASLEAPIVEEQKYEFRMSWQDQGNKHILIFAPGSLDIFNQVSTEHIEPFLKAIQYGFTGIKGSKGLKKMLQHKEIFELKPGRSAFRMILRRDPNNQWIVIATVHKDNVNNYINNKLISP